MGLVAGASRSVSRFRRAAADADPATRVALQVGGDALEVSLCGFDGVAEASGGPSATISALWKKFSQLPLTLNQASITFLDGSAKLLVNDAAGFHDASTLIRTRAAMLNA